MDKRMIEDLEQKQSDYKKVFDSDSGKRVLDDLKRRGFFFNTTLPQDNSELKMAYREGMRAMALHIKTMLEYDFEAIKKRQEASNG